MKSKTNVTVAPKCGTPVAATLPAAPCPELEAARSVLSSTFGFDRFRDGQEPVLTRLLAGKSVVAIFPTGGGKSLCYQLPALMWEGVTVVISPLIALMKDQLDFLTRRGVAAARLDSSLTFDQARQVHEDIRERRIKLLYVAPERLANERFRATLRSMKIALLAVDEAHCISEWGHNFRPDYLKIADLARELGVERVLALTATATPEVAQDIARSFNVDKNDIVQTGFHRPNLFLRISTCAPDERKRLLLERLDDPARRPAIVYVTLQRTAETVASWLKAAGLPASHYHAGLDPEERNRTQDWFMGSQDAVVVATIAFGMGLDKANIRSVYHYNLPKSLENYAQEIGRAGRDGQTSVCELMACANDVVPLENFSYGDTPVKESIRRVLGELDGPPDTDLAIAPTELSVRHDVRPLVLETLLTYIELRGFLKSTGPFYQEYQFQLLDPIKTIVATFDAEQGGFVEDLLALSTGARKWRSLDIGVAARSLLSSRSRITSIMDYLEQLGHIKLKVSGVRHGFRRLKPFDLDGGLADELAREFLDRERRDIERLQRVLRMAGHRGCVTSHLLAYFGETLSACGHCGWCAGERPAALDEPHSPIPGELEAKLVDEIQRERHEALATARQLTRFLCGLPSPATRSRLARDRRFGSLEEMRFNDVLRWLGG